MAKKTRKQTAKPKAPAEEPLVEKTTVMEQPDEVETATVVSSGAEAPFVPFGAKVDVPVPVAVPADGTLIRMDGNPIVYVMNRGQRRQFASKEAFIACGFGWGDIIVLPPAEIDPIPVGPEVVRQGDL